MTRRLDRVSPLAVPALLEIAKEMVEIFKDIPADHELFTTFSLITASELPEYTTLVSRLERTPPGALPPEHQDQLIALSLRLIPARHRLGTIDAAFMAKVVAARQRFAETANGSRKPELGRISVPQSAGK